MAGYGGATSMPSMAGSSLKGAQKLKQLCEAGRPGKASRKPVFGSWQMFPGPGLARIIASTGFHWILVDMEHGAIGDTEMHSIIPPIILSGVSPIVRVPAPSNEYFKRALDAGAVGVMVPMVETPEQAKEVVRMCKFPPEGMRGCGSPFAPSLWGQTGPEYVETANDNVMVIVQIETPLGLKNVNEIAAVQGIDMLFIGPNDLACSLGNRSKNYMDIPSVQEAIETIRAAAENAGKLAGIWCTTAEQAADRFKQGFQMMNVGADIVAITSWMGSELAKAEQLSQQ